MKNEFGKCNHQCSTCLIWCDERSGKTKTFNDLKKEMQEIEEQLKNAEKDLKNSIKTCK